MDLAQDKGMIGPSVKPTKLKQNKTKATPLVHAEDVGEKKKRLLLQNQFDALKSLNDYAIV